MPVSDIASRSLLASTSTGDAVAPFFGYMCAASALVFSCLGSGESLVGEYPPMHATRDRNSGRVRARVPAWPSEINHRVAATSIMLLLPITSLLMPLFSHVDAVYVSFILFHIAPAGETMSISPVVPFPPLVLPPHARYLTQHTFTLFSRSFSMHSSHSYHLPPPIEATVLAFLPYPLVPPPSSHPLCPFS